MKDQYFLNRTILKKENKIIGFLPADNKDWAFLLLRRLGNSEVNYLKKSMCLCEIETLDSLKSIKTS